MGKTKTKGGEVPEALRDPAGALERLRAASARYDAARAAHATATRDAQGYRASLAAQYRQARTHVDVIEAEIAVREARAEALRQGAGHPCEVLSEVFGAHELAEALAPLAAARVAAEREIARCDAAAEAELETMRETRQAAAAAPDRDPSLGPPRGVPGHVWATVLAYERTGGRPDARTLARMVGHVGEVPRMTPEEVRAAAIEGRWPGRDSLAERLAIGRRGLAEIERKAGEEAEEAERAQRDAEGAAARDAKNAKRAAAREAARAQREADEAREVERLREIGRAALLDKEEPK